MQGQIKILNEMVDEYPVHVQMNKIMKTANYVFFSALHKLSNFPPILEKVSFFTAAPRGSHQSQSFLSTSIAMWNSWGKKGKEEKQLQALVFENKEMGGKVPPTRNE